MMIQITKDQALKLWKKYSIIIRSRKKVGNVWEITDNVNNSMILNHSEENFFIDLDHKNKEKAHSLIEKRMLIALFSSIVFCFAFMNFAIYTNSHKNFNFIMTLVLFSIAFFGFVKASNSKDINNFIENL